MSTVQSVERAFSILRSLAVSPAGVSELAGDVDLPKSTVARLLNTLESIGAVERNGDALYRIGSAVTELAGSVDASVALVSTVRPHLKRLSAATREAAGFGVPEGFTIHFISQEESPNPVQVRDYTGLSLPMHVGPSGLCVMAEWPQDHVRQYLMRPLEAFTVHTVVDPYLIEKRLEAIRRDGYCWVYEEFAEGINSIAAPVYDSAARVIGALHVHGPSYRFPAPGQAENVAGKVREAAVLITVRAGNRS